MNNFIFENTTKVFFGKGCVKEYLACLTKSFEGTVMLAYGGGSIKKNGIYEVALAGIEALEDFILEIGLLVTLRDLGIKEKSDLKAIADSCACVPGVYKTMTHEEILEILKECY